MLKNEYPEQDLKAVKGEVVKKFASLLEKYKVDNHSWRKPNIGMLLQAKNSLSINLNDSWIIGDRISDIRAGENAGIKGGVYLNAKNNKHVSKSNFILKYKDNLDDLNWLIDDLSNSCF